MLLATIRRGSGTYTVRVEGGKAIDIAGYENVGDLLQNVDWREVAMEAAGDVRDVADILKSDWAPVIPNPTKIVCVGLNYRSHILEMGRDLPDYPTLFTKFPEALIGPYDPIEIPSHVEKLDWEGEIAVIVGKRTENVEVAEAAEHIAGYAIINDVTARDYQYRTAQWLQGKTFRATSPFGPYLNTGITALGDLRLTTRVNDTERQLGQADDLLFTPTELVSYISQIVPLNPGDVIATGTPGGVGHAMSPAVYLQPGDVVSTSVAGLGDQTNRLAKSSIRG